MTHKLKKEEAIKLRKSGLSIRDIANRLGCSKGTVSTWVSGVRLTDEQKLKLKKYNHSDEVVERRRQSRLANELAKRNSTKDDASREIRILTREQLKILGVALYWGEGGKTKFGVARITNSDTSLIKMAMRFFREVCNVPEGKFRAQIHIHSPSVSKQAEKYWSDITGIPTKQFYKTYSIKSRASKNKRFTLPYGTLDISVNSIDIHLKILGWIDGYKKQAK